MVPIDCKWEAYQGIYFWVHTISIHWTSRYVPFVLDEFTSRASRMLGTCPGCAVSVINHAEPCWTILNRFRKGPPCGPLPTWLNHALTLTKLNYQLLYIATYNICMSYIHIYIYYIYMYTITVTWYYLTTVMLSDFLVSSHQKLTS